MQVVALIHEENGVFGASFPDFLGCTTVADSLDAIIPKAAEALAFHVEGLIEDGPLPPVRTLAQLRKDPVFREDSAGAMIALVPYAPPARAARINITLDESLLERVDRAAEAAGETRSGFLAAAARQRLASEAGTQEKPSHRSAAYEGGAPPQAHFDESVRRYRAANTSGKARKRTRSRRSPKRTGRSSRR
ncbi:MAG TPA: type II toxin-antitoxin system HicB family antitoxin [Xanthobacteraceae bacterium]|nr:type II toxin-antitoxin system HicB family antitoxin [Xanthobacteraceae bacterium]